MVVLDKNGRVIYDDEKEILKAVRKQKRAEFGAKAWDVVKNIAAPIAMGAVLGAGAIITLYGAYKLGGDLGDLIRKK